MPVPNWIDYPAIALSTGEKRGFKLRIIPIENIIDSSEEINQVVSKPSDRVFSVAGSKGNTYTVTIGKHNHCTCPAFQFRRSCKHVVEAMKGH